MQQPQEKRRCSILKKRRSRSLSPSSPLREHTARRASRRISFSGKHNVREFFTNENAAIVWGETYDVSTEKHVLSNEQITLQSTRLCSTLQTTRNESDTMDISNVISTHEEKKPVNSRPSIMQQRPIYDENEKENIVVNNDTDMELSLFIQPSKPEPSKPLFKVPSTRSSGSAQSFRVSMFNFAHKEEPTDPTIIKEKTNGSDNMDISGIELTDPSEEPQVQNRYRDWLKQNNFIAKSKMSDTDNQRKTINEVMDIQLDKSHFTKEIEPVMESKTSRKTMNEQLEMSIETIAQCQRWAENNHQKRRETINQALDMQLETICSPVVHQSNLVPNSSSHSKRATIHKPSEISIDKEKDESNCAQLSDMSIELTTFERKYQSSSRRQTIHEVQNISLDTPSFGMNPRQITVHQVQDMSFDPICGNSPTIQSGNSNVKNSREKISINELKDMSFDSSYKSNAQTINNKTIFGDMSMELQNTAPYMQLSRKSVICKSPSKNATKFFNHSQSFELTKGVDQNSMYLSFHPLHSTKLNDMNCSKFTNMEFDKSIQINNGENTIHLDVAETQNEVYTQEQQLKQVQMFNQTTRLTIHQPSDLEISEEDSPLPTAKKYNLNKTPFYYGVDKENDPAIITMHGSDLSSLDLTNNSKVSELDGFVDFNQEQADDNRGTVLFNATISNDSKTEELTKTNIHPIEISDGESEPENPVHNKRKTCFHEVSMALEPPKAINTLMTQSIIQITPMKIDDDSIEKPLTRADINKRLTIVQNESIALDDTPVGSKNVSTGLEESKLTFIEDNDENDQICNTKIDLAVSLECSDIDDFVDRKYPSFNDNKSYDFSKLNLNSEISLPSMRNELTSYSTKETEFVSPTESIPQIIETMKMVELNAFKKSNRLRHSNVFDVNTMADENQSESIAKEESSIAKIISSEPEPMAMDAEPVKTISLAPVNRSSLLRLRNSTELNTSANETSYLSKSTADIPLSKIKLDFSGYEKLVGLATIDDIANDFFNRMDQINQRIKHQEEERTKFANGEIDHIDIFNNNDEELESQNVEAPSWSFLFRNKMKWEDEEQQTELDRLWEERLIGAYLPAIPDISILTLNKCRILKNWKFDDTWFFQGNIHLRNITMPVFKVCLIYDPETVAKSVETYGSLRFIKINHQFCPEHLKYRNYPTHLLEVQELKSMLPKNLLSLCETSAHLSEFDEKMHEYCAKVQKKVNRIQQICRKTKALIKEENGIIYIIKSMLDFERNEYQEYIIQMTDVDSTEWRNVRTKPTRVLNQEIKTVPKGVAFIKELLTNDSKYIPWK